MTPEPFVAGYRLTDGTELNFRLANPMWSVATDVAATAGGDLETSIKIYNAITNVVTAGASNAGLVLPQAIEGTVLFVNNASANTVVLFADGNSSVNGIPGDVGDLLQAGKSAFFIAIDNFKWISADFGGGGVLPTFTPGSVIFAGATGELTEDNPNFFWDDTNNRLGIGNKVPAVALDVTGGIYASADSAVGAPPEIYPGFTNLSIGGAGLSSNIDWKFANGAIGISAYVYSNGLSSEIDGYTSSSVFKWSIGYFADYGGTYIMSGASDPLLFFIDTNEKMRLTAAGDLGIGTSTPYSILDIHNVALKADLGPTLTISKAASDANGSYDRAGRLLWRSLVDIGYEKDVAAFLVTTQDDGFGGGYNTLYLDIGVGAQTLTEGKSWVFSAQDTFDGGLENLFTQFAYSGDYNTSLGSGIRLYTYGGGPALPANTLINSRSYIEFGGYNGSEQVLGYIECGLAGTPSVSNFPGVMDFRVAVDSSPSNTALMLRITSKRNLCFGTTAAGADAVGVIAMWESVPPTSSPLGVGQIYIESGALKYRGASGTITTIAPA